MIRNKYEWTTTEIHWFKVWLCIIPRKWSGQEVTFSKWCLFHCLRSHCCHSAGVGLATVVISFVFSTYYMVLIGWALFYLFHSFGSPLPWTSCNSTWNTDTNCSSGILCRNSTASSSASQQFFEWEFPFDFFWCDLFTLLVVYSVPLHVWLANKEQ